MLVLKAGIARCFSTLAALVKRMRTAHHKSLSGRCVLKQYHKKKENTREAEDVGFYFLSFTRISLTFFGFTSIIVLEQKRDLNARSKRETE